MSWQKSMLNTSLRLFEKPHLAKAAPAKLRSSFEAKARFWFKAPKGVTQKWEALGADRALWVTSQTADPETVILYFHGGGYVFGSPRTHSAMLGQMSYRCGMTACLPEYRLAPEHPFPAAFDDAVSAYQALLSNGIAASKIVIGGDSAGGGIALALLAEILRHDMPKPAGVFAFSPLTDTTYSGTSIQQNAAKDVVLVAARVDEMAEAYLADADPKDPRASPLFADFSGSCPVWLCVGDTEILLDDTTRMADRMTAQNVDVTTVIEDNLPHVWPMFHGLLPEARQTLDDLAAWITRTLFVANDN